MAAEPAIGGIAREVMDPLIIANEREEILIRLERGEKSPITIIEHLRHDGTTVTVQGRGATASALSGSYRPGPRGRVRSGSGNAPDSATRRDPEWRDFEVKKGGRFTQLRYAPAGT